MPPAGSVPTRRVVHGDALAWLAAEVAPEGASVVTSLPDVSEMPVRDVEAWKSWFVDAARRVIRWTPEDGVAIFFQSDVRASGTWVHKGYLVLRAAELEGASLVWHKIACREPPGTVSVGRPVYSHMICVARRPRPVPRRPGPDVLPSVGAKNWSKAMGVEAIRVACEFLRDEVGTRVVVDPFCGKGTALAVANALGMDALGVELVARRCRVARNFVVSLTPPGSPGS